MGKRGPPPRPAATMKARGTYRADRHGGGDGPPVEAPSCPAWLSAEAKAEWKRATKYLVAAGLVAACDRAVLAAYCEAWADYVLLAREVRERAAQGGTAAAIAAGLLGARDKAADRMARLAAQFGFSPSSRRGVQVRVQQREQPDDGQEPKLYKIRG